MTPVNINLKGFGKNSPDLEILKTAMAARETATECMAAERYVDALERVVSALRSLREFSDYENEEFRALLVALLFDLSEVHYMLKDYKQSEKELDMLFKVLDPLVKRDPERFGPAHIMAMELSTRILRSRKKTLEMLVKQQLVADELYEKVNKGVVAATDRLVDSLRKVGQLLASSGDYRGAMKFLAEAIKISKKRAGKVTRKEVKMTIEMAEIMMRVNSMRPRAKRLLTAILPHAITLETIELEEEILALIEIVDADLDKEPKWKTFFHSIVRKGKEKVEKIKDSVEDAADDAADELEEHAEKVAKKARKAAKKAEKAAKKAKNKIKDKLD